MSRGLLIAGLVACALWARALAQDPPAPVRVGSPGAAQPQLIRQVTIVYPETARAARVQGIVILEAAIDASGRVSKALVIRSIPLLDDAAARAVRQWEFAPPVVNDQATPVVTRVFVNFTLAAATAPAPADPTSPSGMPADFAVVYSEPCKKSLRHVLLTRSTHDLEDVYRALSTAGLMSGTPGLLSWQDSTFVARTTVLLDRIEVVVPTDPPVVCPDSVAAAVVKIQSRSRVDAYVPANYELYVRAGGTWTRLWPPEKRELLTSEYEKRLSAVRKLAQKAIAGKR